MSTSSLDYQDTDAFPKRGAKFEFISKLQEITQTQIHQ